MAVSVDTDKLRDLRGRLDNLRGYLDVENKQDEIARLEKTTTGPDFWNDQESAQKVLKRIKDLKRGVESWQKTHVLCEDIETLHELAIEENDEVALAEVAAQIDQVEKEVQHLEFVRKLSGEDDAAPAILGIHSGAGGTESCDWCEMLFRMYTRWMERKGYDYTVLDAQPGEEAGLKSVAMEVSGEYAYGHLKAEIGVHRLVRISPFDANARRHTSFASVHAYPVLAEADDLELDEKDIRVDTYRASGAGGQHVNKTDSAVRMTHIPTGIVVQCQNERSQMKNRATAQRILKSRVKQFYKEEEEKKQAEKQPDKKKIEWGSQIRSYVLHPYNMVKDLRTGKETSNTQAVLDGDIDGFIESFLLQYTS
ncbi:MAG: peptide chain release factor 2 [Chitinivibrionales bacterium]|nr:peptide chain release factor 2 [Chitinivibrionales bacterium]MBD3396733.1 peptide chain release factor 2 [Chitinivibrionales bacterium]